jgi:murein DD-endopeptidase MepM/ murein hydrolase activator NlpD
MPFCPKCIPEGPREWEKICFSRGKERTIPGFMPRGGGVRRLKSVCFVSGAVILTAVLFLSWTPVRAQLPPVKPPPILPPNTPEPSPEPSQPPPNPQPPSQGGQPAPAPQPGKPALPAPGIGNQPPPSSGSRAPSTFIPVLPRSGPGSTGPLIRILAPLTDRGMSLTHAMSLVAPPFPVAGLASYTDDWLAYRCCPYPHQHQGTDIFADFGTPIIAPGPGVMESRGMGGAGGLAVWILGDDGQSYYFAHLKAFSAVKPGDRVTGGTVIGYVGDTGNAEGGRPHLHFEIHPPIRDAKGGRGSRGPAINPKPYLDIWLRNAETKAGALVPQLLGQLAEGGSAEAILGTGRDNNVPPGDLILYSVLEPTLGSLGLARQAAAQMTGGDTGDGGELAAVRRAVESPYLKLEELIARTQGTGGLLLGTTLR